MVCRRISRLPSRVRPKMWVKPRKAKVSGLPCPRARRFSWANRPIRLTAPQYRKIHGSTYIRLKKCYSKPLKCHTESARPQPCRSASMPLRGILFARLETSRNGAECGPFRPFVRTAAPGLRGRLWAVFVSSAHFLKQPNHAVFGTDVGGAQDQSVTGHPEGSGFERAALKRSQPGSNYPVRRELEPTPACRAVFMRARRAEPQRSSDRRCPGPL